MSVTTTADLHRTDAKNSLELAMQHLKDARHSLELVIDPEIWGYNEWVMEFTNNVRKDLERMTKIERKLNDIKNKHI